MTLTENLEFIKRTLPDGVTLCAVSKFHSAEAISQLYSAGHRVFGESRPQEFAAKAAELPRDIEWHFIGHLQTNKVGLVVPVAAVIESVDSERLLAAISKEAVRVGRVVDVLLQVHIAEEESKQGFSSDEIRAILSCSAPDGVRIVGLMGMATYTEDMEQVRREFLSLRALYDDFEGFTTLSMGMSGDYLMAVECGSTSVRVGSAIFGHRGSLGGGFPPAGGFDIELNNR